MISDIQIKLVDHPHPEVAKQPRYMALTFKQPGSESYLNMDYVEETLADYVRTKQITTLEYLEALSLVQEYKQKRKK